MDIQEIIVGILVLASFVWAIRRIVQNVKRIKRNESPCAGCGCDGCPSLKGGICDKKA